MDASYTVLSLIEGYINNEKPAMVTYMNIHELSYEVCTMLQNAITHERYRYFEIGQVFESCKWSKSLSSLTTTYTLQKYYVTLLKQHERMLRGYNRLAKTTVLNMQYSEQKNVVHKLNMFYTILSTTIKSLIHQATYVFLTNPLDDLDEHRIMFDAYDDRCMGLIKSMEHLLDSQMILKDASSRNNFA